MTDKWADYLISAVRYNAAGTHIDKVRVHEDKGEKIGSPGIWERSAVVTSLEANYTFMTITKSSEGAWQSGAKVGIVTVRGQEVHSHRRRRHRGRQPRRPAESLGLQLNQQEMRKADWDGNVIQRFNPEEIVSHEYGGPIAVWNHRLTFVPTSPTSCCYTDAVEIQARTRALTPLAALFAALMYRYRQARWRALARVLAP